jgi:hypothetical protein
VDAPQCYVIYTIRILPLLLVVNNGEKAVEFLLAITDAEGKVETTLVLTNG